MRYQSHFAANEFAFVAIARSSHPFHVGGVPLLLGLPFPPRPVVPPVPGCFPNSSEVNHPLDNGVCPDRKNAIVSIRQTDKRDQDREQADKQADAG